MKNNIYKQGFTLIELLVVIAIIGILSGIVLTSLNTARQKAKDARVISGTQQSRVTLETVYDGSAYPGLTGGEASSANTPATAFPAGVVTLQTDATAQGGAITMQIATNASSIATAYAIYGQLVSDSTKYFCIDSTGKTNPVATTKTTIVCP